MKTAIALLAAVTLIAATPALNEEAVRAAMTPLERALEADPQSWWAAAKLSDVFGALK